MVGLNMKLVDGLQRIHETRKGLPTPFSIEFFKFNESAGTGGERVRLEDQVGAACRWNPFATGTITVKSAFGKGHPHTIHIRNIDRIDEQRIYW
ncbi:MAG: hypothetical protein ACPG5W_03815 [Flavobacteriales bacterium]